MEEFEKIMNIIKIEKAHGKVCVEAYLEYDSTIKQLINEGYDVEKICGNDNDINRVYFITWMNPSYAKNNKSKMREEFYKLYGDVLNGINTISTKGKTGLCMHLEGQNEEVIKMLNIKLKSKGWDFTLMNNQLIIEINKA